MHVTTRLVILRVNFKEPTYECLLIDDKLPETKMTNDIYDTCKSIVKEYLDIDTQWVKFALIKNEIDDDTFVTYYSCLIPYIVDNLKGQWTEIGKTNEHIQKIVYDAHQKATTSIFR